MALPRVPALPRFPDISLPRIQRRPRRAARPRPTGPPLTRAAIFLRTLPDHRWLDRLVRGRAWIPLFGVLLTGIVFMQVEVLKLGASIGRSMTSATELQSRNQLLRASVAQLSDESRIERMAVRLGMVMPGPTEVHFVSAAAPGILGHAISGIQAPNPQSFLTGLQAEHAAAVAADPLAGAGPTSSTSTGATGTTLAPPAGSSAAGAATPATGGATTSAAAPTSSSTSSSATASPASPSSTTAASSVPAATATGGPAGATTAPVPAAPATGGATLGPGH